MSELDDLLASLSPAEGGMPPDGVNPVSGRPRITVTPRREDMPPPPPNAAPGAPGPVQTAPAPQAPPQARNLDPRARELAIRTILGEAAGEGAQGMQAVAHVILNRLDSGRWGDSVPKVVASKGQFEPWMTQQGRSRMYRYSPDSPEYQAAASALDAAMSSEDITQGATHFYAPRLNARLAQVDGRKAVPDWAQGDPITTIGSHQFYAPDRQPAKPGTGPSKSPVQVLSDASSGKSPAQPQVMQFAAVSPQPVQPGLAPQPAAAPPSGLDQLLAQAQAKSQDLPVPQAPPGAIIHNAGGTSTLAGTNLTAQRPASGDERETAAAMEALRQRGAGRDFGAARHGLPAFEGYTANFGDEAVSALAGMIAKARGGNFQDAYDVAQQIFKQEMAREEADHPTMSAVGEMAGAIANPLTRAGGRGGTLWERMVANAKSAGLFGGVSGVGAGDGAADRAARGGIGATVGFALGGVATPVVEGIAKGASVAFNKPIEMIRRAWNPAGAAERMTAAEKAAAERVDPTGANRLLDSEITPTGPAAMVDTMGAQGQKLARTVRNVSPEAEYELNNLIQPRYVQQAERLTNWVQNKFGFPNTKALEDAIDKAQSSTNRVNYKAAYADGDRPVYSNKLIELLSSDEVMDAVRKAIKNWRTYALADGYGAMNPPLKITPDGRIEMLRKPNGVPVYPNLQFWDYVRREVSGMARENRATSGALKRIAADMNAELDKIVPSYEVARKGAAGFFGAEDALEAGANFFKAKSGQYGIDEARAAIAKMNPAERQLFKAGYTNSMLDRMKETGFRQDVVKQLFKSPADLDRARAALGGQAAREMQAVLRVEGIMQQALEAVRGNSTTMAQIAGAALFEGGDPTGNMIGNMSIGAVVGHMLAKGNNAINRRVAEHVAKLLTSKDPQALQRVASMAMRNRRLWDALADVEQRLVSGTASRTPAEALPGLNSLLPVRASDQQPDVDRPRSQ